MIPYNSEEHAGGHLVRDPATGRHRVEWFPVEKSTDDDEQPVPFRKGDDAETAISAKDRIKASKKRAKRDAKNRKKAAAAAETNRLNLNKGVDMKEPLITVAKAMVERDYTPRTTTKLAFWKALTALAEKKRQPGQSREQSFAKAITTGDGETLYRAYRLCKNGPEPTSWDGEDGASDADDVPVTSTAYDTMAAKARKLAAREGIDFSVAFSRIASDRPDLMAVDKAHHFAKVAKAYGGR